MSAGPITRGPADRPAESYGDTSAPHSCRCGARWGGANTCHCGACHETFTGITAFDLHRRGDCGDPAELGLVDAGRGYPCWARPGSDPRRWDARC